MARDIYDEPTIQPEDDDFIRMEQVGDGVQGTILKIDIIPAKFGPVLKYTMQLGAGREGSFLAGSKNLKGQLMSMKPRPGDWLDIKLVELRPTTMGSPLKVFEVNVMPAGQPTSPVAVTHQAQPDDDLFAS
jgi:hypothetical protein